ncbi:MAG: UbiD family decarboxylase [Magnetococcales bacterium]|nr:UbiD family decarboxylase [Magnetococcales bacterium]
MAATPPKAFDDLRAFVRFLEERGELVRVRTPVDPHLEVTEICRRLMAQGGPAVLFTNVKGSKLPLLANLFGTQERVGMAIGRSLEELEGLGDLLAEMRNPRPPTGGVGGALDMAMRLSPVRHMPTRRVKNPPCQEVVWAGAEIDLFKLPLMTCWPEDAGPLITWPMVITQGPEGGPVNVGVYRMQVIGKDRAIMRWLPHRGGAQHFRRHNGPMPVVAAIGADPGLLLAAVTPIPETLSEFAFAGLLREKRVEIAQALTCNLPVPARAEIILEGVVDPLEMADEGPFGDHTGYYNEVESFPVFTVKRVTMRRDPIYLSTFTGRPPDEPAILALALNRVFTPLLKRQFPEITAFHLPMEACSYRVAVVAIEKGYPGHAFRVMTGIWGFLRQFLYTKFIIVVDSGVPVADWPSVMEAMSCNVNAARDVVVIPFTPIDYLDFASPQPGLGGKMGLDATAKLAPELEAVPHRGDLASDPACDWPSAVLRTIPYIRHLRIFPGGGAVALYLDKTTPGQGRKAVEALWRLVPPTAGAEQVWVCDDDLRPGHWGDLLWAMTTRSDPGRDVMLDRRNARFAIDATRKFPQETVRQWGRVLVMDEETQERVTARWGEYGLPGASLPEEPPTE